MPLIKVFIYFIVLKVGVLLIFDKPITVLAAALAAVAFGLIESVALGLMAPGIGAHMVKARFGSATRSSLLSATMLQFVLGYMICCGVLFAVIFGFSEDLWFKLFRYPGWRASPAGSALKICLLVFLMTGVNYWLMVWSIDKSARLDRLNAES